MDSVLMALKMIGVEYDHVFSSDIDANCRALLRANYGSQFKLYKDLTRRKTEKAPAVDLYVAGFPCQPFSLAGLNKGTKDVRGRVIFSIMDYIRAKKPALVLLENVKGLVLRHKKVLKWILARLKEIGYTVDWAVLNACQHGVPQNRERLIVQAILTDRCAAIVWPSPLKPVQLSLVLDPIRPTDDPRGLPPASQSTARRNVEKYHALAAKKGINLATSTAVIDVDGTKGHVMHNKCPCVTRTRGATGGHWVVCRGRRTTESELEKLFGLHLSPPSGGQAVSLAKPTEMPARVWGGILGNSIPIPLLARVLALALPNAKLTGSIHDPWRSN